MFMHKSNTIFINLSNILNWINGGKIDTLNTYIHGRLLSWFGTDTSIKSGRVRLVLWAQTLPSKWNDGVMQLFAVVSKMPTLTYNRVNNFIIKNAIILNIIHTICKNCNNSWLFSNCSFLDNPRWHNCIWFNDSPTLYA